MTRKDTARNCGQAANVAFYNEAREAVVSFPRPALDDSIVAYIKLNFRDQISSEEPSVEMYLRLIRTAFLELLDAGTIQERYPLTTLAWNYLDEIRCATGIRVQSLPAPAPVVDAESQLRAEIQKDWVSISGDKVRQKAAADSNYRRLLEEMLASDAIVVPTAGRSNFIKIEGPDLEAGNRY